MSFLLAVRVAGWVSGWVGDWVGELRNLNKDSSEDHGHFERGGAAKKSMAYIRAAIYRASFVSYCFLLLFSGRGFLLLLPFPLQPAQSSFGAITGRYFSIRLEYDLVI